MSLGPQEIIIILIAALILFGPKKLPEIGKSLGEALREIRKASRSIMDSVQDDQDNSFHTKELTHNDSNSNRNA